VVALLLLLWCMRDIVLYLLLGRTERKKGEAKRRNMKQLADSPSPLAAFYIVFFSFHAPPACLYSASRPTAQSLHARDPHPGTVLPPQQLVDHPPPHITLCLRFDPRYVLLLAAGDTKPEVRDVGLTGLGLHPSQLSPGLSPSGYRAAVQGLGLPGPGEVVSHLVGRHKQLGLTGDLSR